MRLSRPREPKTTVHVSVRDKDTGLSKTQTYYDTDAEHVFGLLDAAAEDAEPDAGNGKPLGQHLDVTA